MSNPKRWQDTLSKAPTALILAGTVAIAGLLTYQKFFLDTANATEFKDVAQGAQALTTSVAIVVGGIWTYQKFIEHRKNKPKPSITLEGKSFPLTAYQRLLRVEVDIKNDSEVLITLNTCYVWWQQILPLDTDTNFEQYILEYQGNPRASPLWYQKSAEGHVLLESKFDQINWPCVDTPREVLLNNLALEPGEVEHLAFDFIISRKTKLLTISVAIESSDLPNTVWQATTLYEIPLEQISGGSDGENQS